MIIDDLPIRVTAEGRWLHGDEELHPKVARLFARYVVPKPDGEYHLELGPQKALLVVSDTAYFVRTLDLKVDSSGNLLAVELLLSDGELEELDPTTMMMSGDDVLYCKLRREGLDVPCRFSQEQAYSVISLAELEGEKAFVTIDGNRWRVNNAYDSSFAPTG